MKRYKHSLSNYHLLTGNMGHLIPVGTHEVLAGDSFRHRTSILMRLSPQLAPVMHPISVRLHHWFVPNRIMWDGVKTQDDGTWEDFITGGPDGDFQGTYPTINLSNVVKGSLADYLGIPTGSGPGEVCALPFRAYAKIFNEFYRDQDLVDEIDENGETVNQDLQRVTWEKDYFTAARPWTQKGPQVTLPLGTQAPVRGIGVNEDVANWSSGAGNWKETGDSAPTTYAAGIVAPTAAPNNWAFEEDPGNPGFPNIWADLSSAEAIDVNDFRKAFALQRYQEARARYGSRYTEYLAYLGIRASDQRLQRPEFLGGGRGYVNFSEILQTASDDIGESQTPVGTLRGHGISGVRSRPYRRFFEEHGWVLSLLSVRPKVMYIDGLHKKWSRRTKEDYFQKELEAIGQQEVLDSEIYADGATGATWGYVDRYRDYREEPSRISGDFRDILNYWHLARDFQSAPALNESFIECNPSKRIFAEQTEDSLWITVNHSLQARRMVNRTAHSRIE